MEFRAKWICGPSFMVKFLSRSKTRDISGNPGWTVTCTHWCGPMGRISGRSSSMSGHRSRNNQSMRTIPPLSAFAFEFGFMVLPKDVEHEPEAAGGSDQKTNDG